MSLLDGTTDFGQTATAARIGLLATAMSGFDPFTDDSVDVCVPLKTDVFSDRLPVIAEAIAKRNWICGFLDADTNGKLVFSYDMISKG